MSVRFIWSVMNTGKVNIFVYLVVVVVVPQTAN
jgi:hypothetical protein